MSRFFLIARIMKVIDIGMAVGLFALMYVKSRPNKQCRRYPLGQNTTALSFQRWQRRFLPNIAALQRFRKGLLASEVYSSVGIPSRSSLFAVYRPGSFSCDSGDTLAMGWRAE